MCSRKQYLKVDNAIYWIDLFPVDNTNDSDPLDSDLSGGYCCPMDNNWGQAGYDNFFFFKHKQLLPLILMGAIDLKGEVTIWKVEQPW